MASATIIKHDAKTGFNDIKGLVPENENHSFITGQILLVLAAITLAYYALKFFKKKVFPQAFLSLTERAIAKLERSLNDFQNQKLTAREHASRSSLILRDFLGESFNFNATELTNQEVVSKLITSTKAISPEPRKELCVMTKKTLKLLEKSTFSDSLTEQFSEFEILNKESINIIKFTDKCLKEKQGENGLKV